MSLTSILGGNYFDEPYIAHLPPRSREYLFNALDDFQGETLYDFHAHLVGTGTGNTGCFVNYKMRSWLHPFERAKFRILSDGAGISDFSKADQQYINRLLDLIKSFPVPIKTGLLAFDKFYNRDGTVDLQKSQLYTPNEYVEKVCMEHPEYFFPVMSVHPYRKDAVEELEKWAERGVKMIKWLPNAMGMDPSDNLCDEFYAIMQRNNMILLSHGGKECSLYAKGYQHLGNPLLLRKPLDMGVKVIVAHCAGLGSNSDMESNSGKTVKNFKLFLRLMEDKKYEGLVFGDISAVTQINRTGYALRAILKSQSIHHRLVNGSDYPLPAVNSLVSLQMLWLQGYISKEESMYLGDIYKFNPLLFDVLLKKALMHPKTGEQFDPKIFKRKIPGFKLLEVDFLHD